MSQIEAIKANVKLAINRARQQQQQEQIFWSFQIYPDDKLEAYECLTREEAIRCADDYVFEMHREESGDAFDDGELISYFYDEEHGPLPLTIEPMTFGYEEEVCESPYCYRDFI